MKTEFLDYLKSKLFDSYWHDFELILKSMGYENEIKRVRIQSSDVKSPKSPIITSPQKRNPSSNSNSKVIDDSQAPSFQYKPRKSVRKSPSVGKSTPLKQKPTKDHPTEISNQEKPDSSELSSQPAELDETSTADPDLTPIVYEPLGELDSQRTEELAVLLNLPTEYIVELVVSCISKFHAPPIKTGGSSSSASAALVSLVKKLDALGPLTSLEPEPKSSNQKSSLSSSARIEDSSHSVPEIPVTIMSSSQCLKFSRCAFGRMLSDNSENLVKREGQQFLHAAILSRMVTFNIATEHDTKSLVTYITSNFSSRYEVAIYWLYALECSVGNEKRYNTLVIRLLDYLKTVSSEVPSPILQTSH